MSELSTQILSRLLDGDKDTKITISIPKKDMTKLFTDTCYMALAEIHKIISDDELDDFQCVEQIIQIFERIGSDGGNRHDFG